MKEIINPYVIIFLIAIVTANTTLLLFGPEPWAYINAFLFIGLDFTIRDKLHDVWKVNLWKKMLALIFAGSAISVFFNLEAGQIAIASFLAFLLASSVDAGIYHFLKNRRWLIKSNVSNAGGAVVDSIIFPTIAFGAFLPEIILIQILCKFIGGIVWSILIRKIRQ